MEALCEAKVIEQGSSTSDAVDLIGKLLGAKARVLSSIGILCESREI